MQGALARLKGRHANSHRVSPRIMGCFGVDPYCYSKVGILFKSILVKKSFGLSRSFNIGTPSILKCWYSQTGSNSWNLLLASAHSLFWEQWITGLWTGSVCDCWVFVEERELPDLLSPCPPLMHAQWECKPGEVIQETLFYTPPQFPQPKGHL